MAAFTWISSSSLTPFSLKSQSNRHWKVSGCNFNHFSAVVRCSCDSELSAGTELKFVLHDALDCSGLNTEHARAARIGFCSEIQKFSDIERETSISVNRRVDLGRAALYIAAEDDSLISHSSVPLPVDDFVNRLDNLCMGYCSLYSSSFQSSPENFLQCIEKYLYVNKGFRRTNHVEQRSLYLNSVLTHRSGSVSMISLIYSEILKMLRMWGLLEFDAEIFFPRDSHSYPRGYQKQKSKESDQLHVITAQSLLVQILRDLKNAFWPFQNDLSRSPFLRAAQAANCFNGYNSTTESPWELASAKAARHRLQRGVWTSVRFGDMRRALSACERLILLKTDDPSELRDYGVLLYHAGFYEEALHYLKLYRDTKCSSFKQLPSSTIELEEDAVEKLIIRLNLILMEEGWSKQQGSNNSSSILFNNSEPW